MAFCFFQEAAVTAKAEEPAQGAPARKAGKSDKLFADVRRKIQREMAESGVPSLAVAVARNGEIVWEEAFGWADLQRRIPATVHTMYSLASVSKPITATGLMVLVEQGKLDLDAPANHYLARDSRMKVWIGDPEEVTLRRLANHTAGLARHAHFYQAEEIPLKPSIEESIRRYGNVVTLPGERYRYSNFGYGILDHLIARTSGATYAEFLRREVFLPLGMVRTSVDIDPGLAEFAAVRYANLDTPIPFYTTEYAPVSELLGDWEGFVRTYAGDFPMTLSFKQSGDIHARLGNQLPVLVASARYSSGRLSGSMAGRLDTPDANRREWRPQHHLDLDLKLRGDVLNGAIVAIAGNSLSHWCELRKKAMER